LIFSGMQLAVTLAQAVQDARLSVANTSRNVSRLFDPIAPAARR
jgi:hypothetical protein